MPLLAVLLSLALGVQAQDLSEGVLKGVAKFAGSLPVKPQETKDRSGVHRLNPLGWYLLDVEAKPLVPLVWLPPLARVVVLPGKTPAGLVAVVLSKEGTLREGYLPVKAIEPVSALPFDPGADEITLFFDEARHTLTLAHEMDSGFEKQYTEFRLALSKRFFCLEWNQSALTSSWAAFKKGVQDDFKVDAADRPAAQKKLVDILFSVHNPKVGSRTMKDETMLVGVNEAWLLSTPKLAAYYRNTFQPKVGDTRFGGGSGEGLGRADNGGKDYPPFIDYKDALLALKDFVAGLGDAALSKTPEARWLAGLSEESFKAVARLIFVHDITWSELRSDAAWADYIPVDQTFAGIKHNHVLSVLIHEINVNTSQPALLPSDTHMLPDDSTSLWKEVADKGLSSIKDANAQRKFFQLNPYLGTIYLGYYADKLTKYAPACR